MRNATLRFLALIVGVLLIGGGGSVLGQGAFAHGAVVALQGTPHLWFADEHGVLHWGGDTRALSGKHVNWNDRRDVSLAELQTYPIGDPWLSAGLLKDGDPIYQVKWETEWELPQLFHIQSIGDVELFGINGSNYGNFVIDRPAWEARYGISAAGLQRGVLAAATASPASPAPVPSGTGDWEISDYRPGLDKGIVLWTNEAYVYPGEDDRASLAISCYTLRDGERAFGVFVAWNQFISGYDRDTQVTIDGTKYFETWEVIDEEDGDQFSPPDRKAFAFSLYGKSMLEVYVLGHNSGSAKFDIRGFDVAFSPVRAHCGL